MVMDSDNKETDARDLCMYHTYTVTDIDNVNLFRIFFKEKNKRMIKRPFGIRTHEYTLNKNKHSKTKKI